MSKRKPHTKRYSVRVNEKQNKALQLRAHMLKTTIANLLRQSALNKRMPRIIFEKDAQYTELHRQLNDINQSLSSINENVQSERRNIVYGLLMKAQQKNGQTFDIKVAEAMLDDKNSEILKKLLDYNSKTLYPELSKVAKQAVKLNRAVNNLSN